MSKAPLTYSPSATVACSACDHAARLPRVPGWHRSARSSASLSCLPMASRCSIRRRSARGRGAASSGAVERPGDAKQVPDCLGREGALVVYGHSTQPQAQRPSFSGALAPQRRRSPISCRQPCFMRAPTSSSDAPGPSKPSYRFTSMSKIAYSFRSRSSSASSFRLSSRHAITWPID